MAAKMSSIDVKNGGDASELERMPVTGMYLHLTGLRADLAGAFEQHGRIGTVRFDRPPHGQGAGCEVRVRHETESGGEQIRGREPCYRIVSGLPRGKGDALRRRD